MKQPLTPVTFSFSELGESRSQMLMLRPGRESPPVGTSGSSAPSAVVLLLREDADAEARMTSQAPARDMQRIDSQASQDGPPPQPTLVDPAI